MEKKLLETKLFWSSLLKNRTQEAKKMCLLEVEKISMTHGKMEEGNNRECLS